MTDLTRQHEDALYERVAQIIEAARTHISRTVNTSIPEEVGDYRKGSAPLSQSARPSKDESRPHSRVNS